MKNKLYKSFFLGLSSAIVATASYALIRPPITNDTVSVLKYTPVFTADVSEETTEIAIIAPVERTRTLVHTIKNGENLTSIFSKLGLRQLDLYRIISETDNGKLFAAISPKKELVAHLDENYQLQELIYNKNATTSIRALRSDVDKFDVQVVSKAVDTRLARVQKSITSSLFLDGKEAGLSDRLILQLANIFAWDINFSLNLRENDQFTVVYEKLYVDGKPSGVGNILAAEFINQGKAYTAVRFDDKQGKGQYFTPEGKGMRKAFLQSPVGLARISSHFNLKRKHPILNRIRAHKGVDYAAKSGTPIKTTGDGKIVYRGIKGGYGRVVIVKHENNNTTLYAHLSKYKKGQKLGSSVEQGDTIGYVGMSGLATGPHLHYEFRVNGVHKNPLKVHLPHSRPITGSLMADFKAQSQPILAELAATGESTLLAQK